MSLQTPILFCLFNRPDLTQQVFSAIRRQRPRTLLVVQDGPRADRNGEAELVDQTRAILNQIDWDCDLRTNFTEMNLGCKQRMATGITWGFAQFDRLIILEDDCLPSDSFFSFCESLLERYAADERISMISGDNFQPRRRSPHTYYFSKWTHIWGWASWRRAWQHFDVNIASWPAERRADWLRKVCGEEGELAFWSAIFERQYSGEIDTWDFPWMYSCWRQQGLTVIPNSNLVTNLGFGPQATHTIDEKNPLANLPRCELNSLHHPEQVIRHAEADAYTWHQIFKLRPQPLPSHKKSPWRRWWPRHTRAAS